MLKQNGLSLVELLIASLLGICILNGLYQVLLNARLHYQKIIAITETTSDAVLAVSLLTHYIKLAGFHTHDTNHRAKTHMPFINEPALLAPKNNILTIRFGGDYVTSMLQDCINRNVAINQISQNTFFVDKEGLACRSTLDNASLMRHLVAGVEAWRIRYGQYHYAPHPHWQFYHANDPALNMAWVRQIRIALVIRAATPSLTLPSINRCQLFDETYRSPADRKIRRCVEFTVAVDNHAH